MPLKLPDNLSVDYFIAATDDHGLKTSALAAGQTVAVTSADPATVVLTADTTVRNAPDGTVCIASGTAKAANPVGAPLTPITITSHISNSDGTPGTDGGAAGGALIPDATDTIEVDPSLVAAQGILFGVPA